ncbi:MAG: hypothetical protein IJ620_02410 [Bacteroidales bacterium]|nr:hypothetical protein [Bacteroidales bacterium]
MPLFHTPKPRQFHYSPRFYDPEKERWEALKDKYHLTHPDDEDAVGGNETSSDDELRYFEEKVRRMERQRHQPRLGWKDLFRRRAMPQFHYTPRFQKSDGPSETESAELDQKYSDKSTAYKVRIRRRYDIADPDYMKPVSGGKIMIYVLLACLLLYWILF